MARYCSNCNKKFGFFEEDYDGMCKDCYDKKIEEERKRNYEEQQKRIKEQEEKRKLEEQQRIEQQRKLEEQRKENEKRILEEQRKLKENTVIQHFSTTFRFFPIIKTVTVKPWQIDKMHSILKNFEYDDILMQYSKEKGNLNKIMEEI